MRRTPFFSLLLAFVLVLFRYLYCYEYAYVTFEHITGFTSPAPFVYRVLVPLSYRIVSSIIEFDSKWFFSCVDFVAGTVLFLVSYRILLTQKFSFREATFLLVGLNAFLILNYAILTQLNIYYPWDIPSLAFLSLAVFFCLREKFWPFFFVTLIAVLNRETAILFPLMYCAFSSAPSRLKVVVTSTLLVFFFFEELFIQSFFTGASQQLSLLGSEHASRVVRNFSYISNNIFLSLVTVLPVPLYWLSGGFIRGGRGSQIGFAALSFYVLAFIYGNAHEPRVFLESSLLTFYPFAEWYRALRLTS